MGIEATFLAWETNGVGRSFSRKRGEHPALGRYPPVALPETHHTICRSSVKLKPRKRLDSRQHFDVEGASAK